METIVEPQPAVAPYTRIPSQQVMAAAPLESKKRVLQPSRGLRRRQSQNKVPPSQLQFYKKPIKYSTNCYADVYPLFQVLRNQKYEQPKAETKTE